MVPLNCLSPPVISIDRSKAVLLLWIFLLFIIHARLSLLYCLVCSFKPCDHLLGKDRPLVSLVLEFSLCFVTFPYGVSGQVWHLLVLIPDLCLLLYFCFLI